MKLNEDWSDFSDNDLRILTDKIADELALREHKRKAIGEIAENMKKMGLSLEDLMLVSKPKLGKAPIKFKDPDNPGHQWSGRGQQPNWLKAAVKQGKSLEDFRV